MYATLLPLAALAASTTAHTIFQVSTTRKSWFRRLNGSSLQEVFVNGVSQGHEVGLRLPSYDGPITDVTSNDLIVRVL
jgi:cellulase